MHGDLRIEVLKCTINTHKAELFNIVNIIFAGRRIEVKIITAGYYENEEGNDFHTLSDEETSQFQNMIMALLVNRNMSLINKNRNMYLISFNFCCICLVYIFTTIA